MAEDHLTFYERERRFLVPDPSFLQADYDTSRGERDLDRRGDRRGNVIVQAYLFSKDGYVVRVRRTHLPHEDGKSFREAPAVVAVKGPRVAAARQEYEMEIPSAMAAELIQRAEHKVSKRRFQVIEGGEAWDVDVFTGDNEGLVIAECESSNVEAIVKPDWCGVEITDDPRYNNESLAAKPYRSWP